MLPTNSFYCLHCRAINMIASRFPSFFEHLECSQCPSSCSIFFPWFWGFFRVVKHHCRLILTQLVAVFRGQVERKKIRKMLNSSSFWHMQISTVFYYFFIFLHKKCFFSGTMHSSSSSSLQMTWKDYNLQSNLRIYREEHIPGSSECWFYLIILDFQ